jgi:hypothetical protein
MVPAPNPDSYTIVFSLTNITQMTELEASQF